MTRRKGFSHALPGGAIVFSTNNGEITGVFASWEFAEETADADPGDGKVRLNNTDPSAATEIYPDNLDGNDNDLTGMLDELAGGRVVVKSAISPGQFNIYAVNWVTDGTGYRQLGVSHIAGGSTAYTDGETLVLQWLPAAAANSTVRARVVDIAAGDPASDYEAGDTVDGITLAEGDLVLRATPGGHASDGFYTASASGGASRAVGWTLYDDFPGLIVSVKEGDTYADTIWQCTSEEGGTLDSTALAFVELIEALAAAGRIREVLTANRTYYVDATDGDDGNDGLAAGSGNAFATIQKAVNVVSGELDVGTHTVTISVADDTYVEFVNVKAYVGSGWPIIQGNTTTPTNCVVTGNFNGANVGNWIIRGFSVGGTGGFGLSFTGGSSHVEYNDMDFAAATATFHIYAASGARIRAIGGWSISGASNYAHVNAGSGGMFEAFGRTIEITDDLAFTTFVQASTAGFINTGSLTFNLNGNTVTGKRYTGSLNGVIQTSGGGASFFPGDAAGTTATGAQYN